MPQATREIKRRIRSIKNTRQITKAMELVSAAKMRKAVQNVLATRTYASLGWELLTQLRRRVNGTTHPLLVEREHIRRIAVVVISSNRGLCGGFNQQLTSRVLSYLRTEQAQAADAGIDIIAYGRRGRDALYRAGCPIASEYVKPDVAKSSSEIQPVSQLVLTNYIEGKYDKVVLAYTDFVSPVMQRPKVRQLLPIIEQDGDLGFATAQGTAAPERIIDTAGYAYEYLFEPDVASVLSQLAPRLLEVQLYQAVLESDASEHSARMMAMRNASDAAKDMIDGLTLSFNQARQAGITAELAEIVGGTVAVSG